MIEPTGRAGTLSYAKQLGLWCALAALVLCCCTAAAHPPSSPMRAQFVSGSPQDAHAFASTSSAAYETDFPKPLVVRVVGAKSGSKPRVRFTCTAPACKLYAIDAPEDFKRIDLRSFEMETKKGLASIGVSLTTPELGTYTVTAEPAIDDESDHRARITFRLTAR